MRGLAGIVAAATMAMMSGPAGSGGISYAPGERERSTPARLRAQIASRKDPYFELRTKGRRGAVGRAREQERRRLSRSPRSIRKQSDIFIRGL
jgi:hypothetical protein